MTRVWDLSFSDSIIVKNGPTVACWSVWKSRPPAVVADPPDSHLPAQCCVWGSQLRKLHQPQLQLPTLLQLTLSVQHQHTHNTQRLHKIEMRNNCFFRSGLISSDERGLAWQIWKKQIVICMKIVTKRGLVWFDQHWQLIRVYKHCAEHALPCKNSHFYAVRHTVALTCRTRKRCERFWTGSKQRKIRQKKIPKVCDGWVISS